MFDRRKRGKAGRMTLTDLSVQWRGATVLVLGDALLDGWYAGTPRQLCREAPVPVVGLDRITFACGGAANAAANVAALGGRAVLAAVVGDDSDGARLRTRLREAWVDARLVTAADRLLARAKARAMAVTLDVDGTVVLRENRPAHRTYARPVSASRAAGAGDAYVAAFTLALSTGAALAEAADVAQLAATVATCTASSSLGTAVCPAGDLLTAADAGDSRVLDSAALSVQVTAHRARGRRIVFTNGCFDVLHSGHVGYLEQAKQLGDILIVAVNSDESVRRLKGENRPVNPVEDRVSVLSALSCVDHVVVFHEDTPAALITEVRPDVYVKGGDYPPELIPEAPLVRQLGGEVRTLDYVPDKSTSKIIERIRSTRTPTPTEPVAGPET